MAVLTRTGHSRGADRGRVERALAFAAPTALILYYALRGGSYDIVIRQEEALALWCLLALAFGLGLLPRSRPRWGASVPLAALGLLALWTAVTLSWTGSDGRTLAELARVLHYLGLLVLVWTLVDRRNWRAVAGGIALAAVLVSALAVASRLFPDAFPTNSVARVLRTDRLAYPFNYWNAVGAFAAMSMAMALAWSAHARALPVRAAALAAVPVCALAVYLTYSRAGVLGAIVGVVAAVSFSRNRWTAALHAAAAGAAVALVIVVVRDHREIAEGVGNAGAGWVLLVVLLAALLCAAVTAATRLAGVDAMRLQRPAGAVTATLATVALAAVAVGPASARITTAWDQFRNDRAIQAPSDPEARLTSFGGSRNQIWSEAVDASREEPLKGIGPGTFEFYWNRQGGEEFVRDAHSLYLESFAELGVPGGLLVILFVVSLIVLAVLARIRIRDPAGAGASAALIAAVLVFAVQAGVDWMWESTAVTVLALLAAATAIAARPSDLLFERPAWAGIGLRVAITTLAVLAAVVQLPGLVSTSLVRESQTAFKARDLDTAGRRANKAVSAEPWSATPYVQRGLIAEAAGDLPGAALDLRRAIVREPANWRHWLLLARIRVEQRRPRAALASLRRARRLRPESAFLKPRRGLRQSQTRP